MVSFYVREDSTSIMNMKTDDFESQILQRLCLSVSQKNFDRMMAILTLPKKSLMVLLCSTYSE